MQWLLQPRPPLKLSHKPPQAQPSIARQVCKWSLPSMQHQAWAAVTVPCMLPIATCPLCGTTWDETAHMKHTSSTHWIAHMMYHIACTTSTTTRVHQCLPWYDFAIACTTTRVYQGIPWYTRVLLWWYYSGIILVYWYDWGISVYWYWNYSGIPGYTRVLLWYADIGIILVLLWYTDMIWVFWYTDIIGVY